MSRKSRTLADLPLFADDEAIGEAVLGFARRKEFAGLAAVRERDGMPKISPFWGGRYVPAVKAYLDSEYGLLGDRAPLTSNGIEGKWTTSRRERKSPAGGGPTT